MKNNLRIIKPTTINFTFIIAQLILLTIICSASLFANASISSVSPTKNAIDIDKSTTISVVFVNDINSSTLTNSTVKVIASLSGNHPSAFSYNSGTKTLTIAPNVTFIAGDVVTVLLQHK